LRLKVGVIAFLAVGLVVALVLEERGSSSDMPDVTGKNLDAAKRAIEDAGFAKEVKVDGGGVLGVIRESNWKVCNQSPPAGTQIADSPRLSVDRSCDEKPEPPRTPIEATEPRTAPQAEPATEPIITRANNRAFAALLKVSDSCDKSIASFAKKYEGRTIKFSGSVVDMALHGDYETRYDFLLAPGNDGRASSIGPAFKFEDELPSGLKFVDGTMPAYVGQDDRFRFKAELLRYDPDQCLLFLEPVSTAVR
jgi:hypothetical protein